ncbi:MAG: hypothetical protein H0T53_14830 [Herpetosiphonaceae bacterium]|nr:hypothetical protein [Herpetosiphonaceae bacterium]
MPAYNFRRVFTELILSGAKNCTIRPPRRHRPTRPGDPLYLFVGMRTKQCQRLGQAICLSVEPISIDDEQIVLAGRPLNHQECHDLIQRDGFVSSVEFYAFFRQQYGLPADLELITWSALDRRD